MALFVHDNKLLSVKFFFLSISVFFVAFTLGITWTQVSKRELEFESGKDCALEVNPKKKNIKQPTKEPCLAASTNILISKMKEQYKPNVLDEVTVFSEKIESELKKDLTEEELEQQQKRIQNNVAKKINYQKNFPRFKISEVARDDFLYFGIQTGRYKDVMRFLGERECRNPELSWINTDIGYLGLFFSINHGRSYGGIVSILNEKDVTPIESSLRISKIEDYFQEKTVPSGHYSAWLHREQAGKSQSFQYQYQDINAFYTWKDVFFESPWLYNGCNKSIATISNFCSLDSGYDMEMKEFFYLSDHDLMLGNLYCKKSNENFWKRIATIEMVRTE